MLNQGCNIVLFHACHSCIRAVFKNEQDVIASEVSRANVCIEPLLKVY